MGLAGAAVADRDDVLAAGDVFRAGQLQHQHLVERRQGEEVEAVEAFDRREPGLLDPPLDHPALTLKQIGEVSCPVLTIVGSESLESNRCRTCTRPNGPRTYRWYNS